MKKVLIITYYWPPTGGSGVQRWLKFVKYLRDFGWEPIVYTPSNPEGPVIDETLLKDVPKDIDVIKTPVWEPYGLYKKFVGKKKDEKVNTGFLSENKKTGLLEKISVWIRGNVFIPDARMFWIKPSVKFLLNYLKEHKIDVIVSTGPPHSMHMIALALKKRLGIKWLADFRDPWTNIDFYEDLMLTGFADRKHHRMEREVLANADKIITVGNTMKEEFVEQMQNAGISSERKVHVITNGYDEDDVYKGELTPDKKFSIAHIGTLTPSRNPLILWKVLGELVKENAEFLAELEIKLVGKVDFNAMQSIEGYGLKDLVNKIDYLPHADIIKLQQESQVLLLLINKTKNAKGILTGKFFEYMAARRPILCIGPSDGDAAAILNETETGRIAGFDDEKALKEIILSFYASYKSGKLSIASSRYTKYSRKCLTGKLAELLE